MFLAKNMKKRNKKLNPTHKQLSFTSIFETLTFLKNWLRRYLVLVNDSSINFLTVTRFIIGFGAFLMKHGLLKTVNGTRGLQKISLLIAPSITSGYWKIKYKRRCWRACETFLFHSHTSRISFDTTEKQCCTGTRNCSSSALRQRKKKQNIFIGSKSGFELQYRAVRQWDHLSACRLPLHFRRLLQHTRRPGEPILLEWCHLHRTYRPVQYFHHEIEWHFPFSQSSVYLRCNYDGYIDEIFQSVVTENSCMSVFLLMDYNTESKESAIVAQKPRKLTKNNKFYSFIVFVKSVLGDAFVVSRIWWKQRVYC